MMQDFNFKKAVAEAKADYPEETAKTTFLDLSRPFPRLRLLAWLLRTSPEYRKHIDAEYGGEGLWHAAESLIAVGGFATRDPLGLGLLAMLSVVSSWPFDNLHYVFNHELGHVVMPEGLQVSAAQATPVGDEWDDVTKTNKLESSADAFAIMRSFNKGTLTRDGAVKVAQNRATDTWFKGAFEHATTVVIDNIVTYVGDVKLSLTPQEVKAIAVDHANKCAITAPKLFLMHKALHVTQNALPHVAANAPAASPEAHTARHLVKALNLSR